ncbi:MULTISPECIES: hypothetical protein [unclassified Bradyrhizobium]|uniref:hypothetical protein n=1 Tax=unclassified Bradyrhizobium TaxID=2631580 RepID=UPI001FFB166D|nr:MULTISPECIES: hypothetical protein [unclassified Bradyrhizobium]MCK1503120.1 hypothetical protein [Bradyrhizobium sp. 188]MCK1568986.1 hypothetical protein [Bradyrhizobium sp. 173]MCK1676641.1 hypothetical protein [Bradyrhizobium sp. 150]
MRTVTEYQSRAAEFDGLAELATQPALQRRYADLAACYRLLAEERNRLIESGEIEPDDPQS